MHAMFTRFGTAVLATLAVLTASTASAETLLMPKRDALINTDVVVWGVTTLPNGSIYRMSFGDGSPDVVGTVADRSYIAAVHQFATAAPTGTTYTVTLTVCSATGLTVANGCLDAPAGSPETATAAVKAFDPSALSAENLRATNINLAIQDGLRYLWTAQVDRAANFPAGTTTHWGGSYPNSWAALITLAFQNHGYKLSNNPAVAPTGIYEKYIVQRGLNYVLSGLTSFTMAAQTAGDPCAGFAAGDAERCIGLTNDARTHSAYETPISILPLAASGALNRTGSVSGLAGARTYGEILQRLVNAVAWGQNEAAAAYSYQSCGWQYYGWWSGWHYVCNTVNVPANDNGRGGWHYRLNDQLTSMDGSTIGWVLLSLLDAQAAGATIPAFVATEFAIALPKSLNADGSLDYNTDPNSNQGSNPQKAGVALQGMYFLNQLTGAQRTQTINYIASRWNGALQGSDYTGWGCGTSHNKGCAYTMFNNFKGLKLHGVDTLNVAGSPVNWYADYQDWLVANQTAPRTTGGGYWSGMTFSCCDNNTAGNAAIAELILSPVALVLPDEDKFSTVGLSPATKTLPEGGTHTVTATAESTGGTAVPGATVVFTVTSGPNAGKTGSATTNSSGLATFTYTDSGQGGTDQIVATIGTLTSNTVVMNWTPVPDAPVAADGAKTTPEDVPVSGTALAADADGNGLTFVIATQPVNGVVTMDGAGAYTYTPNPNFHGTDAFEFRVDDGTGLSDIGRITVTVTPVNDAPVAADEAYVTTEDTPLSINACPTPLNGLNHFWRADGDALDAFGGVNGTALSGTAYTGGMIGQAFAFDGVDDRVALNGTLGGVPEMTVAAWFRTSATNGDFQTIFASQSHALMHLQAAGYGNSTVYTDAGQIDLPIISQSPVNTWRHVVVSIRSGDTRMYINGVQVAADPKIFATITSASDVLIGSGFQGARRFNGRIDDVRVYNRALSAAEAQALAGVNCAVAHVLSNDFDVEGDTIAAGIVSNPSNGSLTLNANGGFTYTPNPNFSGTDSFQYLANDGQSDSNAATVTITVAPANDAPAANDSANTTPEDTPVTGAVTGSDIDGDALTFTAATQPVHGTLAFDANGGYTYTPNANYSGADSFTFTVTDPAGATATGTVSLTVTPVNDLPAAVDDAASTFSGTPVTIAVLANDSDLESGTAVTLAGVAAPANGTAAAGANGTVLYTPNLGFAGIDSFTYTVADPDGGTATATVRIVVTKRTATVTAVDATKVYGTSDPALTATSAGFLAADGITTSATRAAGENVGSYAITPAAAGAALANYDVTYVPANFTITKAAAVADATGGTFTYDGQPHSGACAVAGVNGEVLAGAISYSSGPEPVAAGTYTVNCDFAGNGNYTAASATATITIAKAALTVMAVNQSKTYGTEFTFAGTEFTAAGLAGADAVTSATLTSAGTPAAANIGMYPIVPSAAVGAGLENYTIQYINAPLMVNRATPVVNATGGTFVYDGQPHEGACSATGVFGEDLPASISYPAGGSAPMNAGAYPVRCDYNSGGNYLMGTAFATITINRAPATVTAVDAAKVYGTSDPALTATSSGFVAADGITTSATRAAGENAGGYAITPAASGAALGNYDVNYVNGTFTITPATPVADAVGATFTYDGQAHGGTCTVSGVNGEVLAGTTTYSTGGAPVAAGSHTITCDFAGDANYVAASDTDAILINRAAATVTATAATKVYGAADPALTATSAGFLAADGITTSATRAAGENAGGYAITPAASGAALGNYDVTYVPATFTITPAPLTITATSYARHFGTPNPALTVSYSGFQLADSDASLSGTLVITTTAQLLSPVGVYPIVASGLSSPNYTITYVPGTLEITNAAPVCAAATPSISAIWPPNHQLVPVTLNGVTDADGDALTITVVSIFQDEPTNTQGDGNTPVDGAGIGTPVAQVRAERAGNPKQPGDGRVYHITFTAADAAGGSCTTTVQVGVPHDQRGSGPVDGGALFDSMVPSGTVTPASSSKK